jgi:hypothetical protein
MLPKLFPSVLDSSSKNQSKFQILPFKLSAGQTFKNGLKNNLKQNETDKLSSSLESIKFAFKRLINWKHIGDLSFS